jgi:hypothetical protein
MATMSLMPAKADPSWIHAPDALRPTVGANCRGFIDRSAIGVGVWRFVEGGEIARVYPVLDPATVARPYVLLQFTIWQQVLSYNDEVGCFAM